MAVGSRGPFRYLCNSGDNPLVATAANRGRSDTGASCPGSVLEWLNLTSSVFTVADPDGFEVYTTVNILPEFAFMRFEFVCGMFTQRPLRTYCIGDARPAYCSGLERANGSSNLTDNGKPFL